MAALAVAVMCMGGLIPVATFICPVICMLLLSVVMKRCGRRIAWAWYGAVAILSLLLGPDKEAAAIFLFLGSYPIIKPRMDKLVFAWLWKLLIFNAAITVLYFVFLRLLGLEQILKDYKSMGTVLTAVMLVLGNITFFLVDQLLSMRFATKKRRQQP